MSSKRGQRRKACERKVKYETAALASAHKSWLRRQGVSVGVYRCEHCAKFHVGHPPKRVKQSLAALNANKRASA